jgi:hypothetical protein
VELAADLNGDGLTDYVLSTANLDCEGAGVTWAGSGAQLGGPELSIFVGGPAGSARLAYNSFPI